MSSDHGGSGRLTTAAARPVLRARVLRWTVRGSLAIGLSALAFVLAFEGVDLERVLAGLSESRPWVVVGFFLVQLALHGVRVYRWGLLVRPLGPASWRSVFAAASIGFPATFFLPLRLGEFVRPAMIARSGVPFGGAVATVAVERIADGLFTLGLFFALLRLVPKESLSVELAGFSNLALGLFGGGLALLVGVAFFRKPARTVLRSTVGIASPLLAERLIRLVDRFAEGVLVLGSPGRIAAFFGLTALYWLVNGWATWVLAQGYAPGVPLIAGPFAISVVVFAIMIPAGPAFAGTLEAGIRFGLAPFGVPAELAVVVAVAMHALQLIQMVVLAGLGFLVAGPGERYAARSEPLGDSPADPAG